MSAGMLSINSNSQVWLFIQDSCASRLHSDNEQQEQRDRKTWIGKEDAEKSDGGNKRAVEKHQGGISEEQLMKNQSSSEPEFGIGEGKRGGEEKSRERGVRMSEWKSGLGVCVRKEVKCDAVWLTPVSGSNEELNSADDFLLSCRDRDPLSSLKPITSIKCSAPRVCVCVCMCWCVWLQGFCVPQGDFI